MGYKMKQDKSPVTNAAPPFNNYESLGLSTSGAGQGYVDPAQQSPVDGAAVAAGAGGGGFNATGAGAIAGVAGGLVNEFGESDATKGGYVGTQATSKALEYAGMGAALGPYGMAAGALIGGTMGVINAKKEAKEAKKQAKIAERTKGKGEAMGVLAQNQLALGITKKGKIKMKPIKKLGAVTGTISPNMSMAQYKDEKKFSAIAKELKPINEIKTNPNFATPGTGFEDNSGTNNQPKTVTSGDRAKEALKKAVKTSVGISPFTGAGTSALMLGDLDKNGEMSSYEKKRQNAIDKNMNK